MPVTLPKKNIIIAGAGLSGLMTALKLTKTHPDYSITLFERAPHVGGMYASIEYPEGYVFDHGMHVIYESCNTEIDDLYTEVMPKEDWHIYTNNEKDIAGLFFRGKLQNYSHYVDLRSFTQSEQETFLGEIMYGLNAATPSSHSNAKSFLVHQFGESTVNQVHNPILQSLYGMDSKDADIFATKVTALERVILFDPEVMLDLMKSPKIRSRLAFPDQLNLPPYRINTQKALYPKDFGMSHFIEKLEETLRDRGVNILTKTSLVDLQLNSATATTMTLAKADGEKLILDIDHLIWTAGWPALAHTLKVDMRDLTPQKGPKIVFANLVFDQPPKMDKLYYFYCYDKDYATFRVTNYSNYCPAATKNGNYPVCLELWPSRIGIASESLTDSQYIDMALNELRQFGVIDQHKLVFSKVINSGSEFPLPSVQNTQNLHRIKQRVSNIAINNMTVIGIMAEDGLFFIPDILNDAFKKIALI